MPTQLHRTSFLKRLTCTFVALVAITALAYPSLPLLTLIADSQQYREMSEAVFSGHIFDAARDHANAQHIASSLRPPLFPLLLGIASNIPGMTPDAALVSLHIILGAFVLGATLVVMRCALQPLLIIFATGIALYSAKQVAWGIMSEWLAMAWLFLTCVSYLAWIARPSPRLALAVSLCASLMILTRAALLPWLALMLFMLLQAPRGRHRVTATALVTGLLPLALWGATNLHRIGSFSIVPYEGLNLVATARSLGTIPTKANDTEDQQRFIATINAQGVTVPDSGLTQTEIHRWEGEFYKAFHTNFDTTTAAMRSRSNITTVRATEIGARGLRAHADRYQLFLRGGAYTLCVEYLPLIGACLVTAAWLARRDRRHARWSLGVATICVVSLGYLFVIFGTMLWLHRYFIPVQPILLFCLIVSGGRVVETIVRPPRGDSQE